MANDDIYITPTHEWDPEKYGKPPGMIDVTEQFPEYTATDPGVRLYGPQEGWSVEQAYLLAPDTFNLTREDAAAIDRGEKTALEIKEEKAQSLGMSLREYLTEEEVAMNRQAWNEAIRAGVDPRTGEPLEDGAFESPRTEKYGYGKYGRVDDLHAQGFKYGDKPPEGFQAPDYSPEGRERFQELLFKQIGGNPFMFNIAQELEKATAASARDWFNQAFGGQIRYEDRDKMSRKQKQHWQNQLNRGRAFVEADLRAKRDGMEWMYNEGMKRFDKRAEDHKAIAAEINEWSRKQGDRIVHMFHPDDAYDYEIDVPAREISKYQAEGWIAGTPKKGKGNTVVLGDYKKVYDMIADALDLDNVNADGSIDSRRKALIDRALQDLDLPTLDEIVGAGIDDKPDETWKGKVRRWMINWNPILGTVFGPMDETETAGEKVTKEVPERPQAAQTAPESDIIKDMSGNPIPAVDANGNPLEEGSRANSSAGPIVVAGGYWYKAR